MTRLIVHGAVAGPATKKIGNGIIIWCRARATVRVIATHLNWELVGQNPNTMRRGQGYRMVAVPWLHVYCY